MSERLLTLAEIVSFLDQRYGIRPHKCTVLRWRTRGARGVVLRSKVLGGQRYSAESDVIAFVEQLNAPSDEVSIPQLTPRQAEAAANKSAAKLKSRLGVA